MSPRVAWRAAGLIIRADSVSAGLIFAGTLLLGAAPVWVAWLTKVVIDEITASRRDAGTLVGAGVGLAIATLALRLFPDLLRYMQARLNRRLEYLVRDRMFAKVNTFGGLRLFEQPRFHDLLQYALDSGQNAPQRMLVVFASMLQHGVTVLGFVGILLAIHPFVALLTVLATLPQFAVDLMLGRHRVQMMVRVSPAERRRFFFSSLLVQPHAAKELRLFGLGDHFRRRMLNEVSSIHHQEAVLENRTLRSNALLGILAALMWSIALGFVIRLTAVGDIGAGDLVAFLAGYAAVSGGLATLFSSAAQATEATLAMGYYEKLLATEPDIPLGTGVPAPPLRDAIELRDVWFRYGPELPWVLRGVTLRIPAGRALALVGDNGCGKSTIVKLICRLYRPDKGVVLWDGRDIAEYDLDSLRERIGSVFQDFVRYDLTVAENIGLGDLTRLTDRDRIRAKAVASGVDGVITGFRHGYDTVLSRVHAFESTSDGDRNADLSGGQWQRIALARMLMREDRDVLLLDEPSSGLDPQAEHDVHAMVTELTGGRTRILVSHRLNAVRNADEIAVLADGRIVESGTHAELIASGGRYCSMFLLQSSGYAGVGGPAGVTPQPHAHDAEHALLGQVAEAP